MSLYIIVDFWGEYIRLESKTKKKVGKTMEAEIVQTPNNTK